MIVRCRRYLAVACLALTACASQPRVDEYKLYYLGGQSNMEGYGYTAELSEHLTTAVPNVMIFSGRLALDDDPGGGAGIWEPLRPGFGTGFVTDGAANTLSDRFGPELFFGRTLVELDPNARIAIVKYALGGSGLALGVGYGSWHPDYQDGAGTNQYDHALTAIRSALSQPDIDGDGKPDRLIPSGIVWMQGEADAHHSQAAADEYFDNLQRLMELLRAALNADALPLAIGKITDSGMADDGKVMDYIETVQRAQKNFVESDACAAYVTVTDNISHSDDAWHYDTAGYIRLGAAFAEAIRHLEKTCDSIR